MKVKCLPPENDTVQSCSRHRYIYTCANRFTDKVTKVCYVRETPVVIQKPEPKPKIVPVEKPTQYSCHWLFCGEIFRTKASFDKHLHDYHGVPRGHQWIHPTCTFCGKKFAHQSLLDDHFTRMHEPHLNLKERTRSQAKKHNLPLLNHEGKYDRTYGELNAPIPKSPPKPKAKKLRSNFRKILVICHYFA